MRRKGKRKHLRQDREGANLPFGADNLKLDMVQFRIASNLLRQNSLSDPDSKSVDPQGSVGSNPTVSARMSASSRFSRLLAFLF